VRTADEKVETQAQSRQQTRGEDDVRRRESRDAEEVREALVRRERWRDSEGLVGRTEGK
jgi:hypothetical protein